MACGGGVIFHKDTNFTRVRGGNWHGEEKLLGPSLELCVGALARIQLMTSWLLRMVHKLPKP